ncbi:MAG: succinylglutamate desuccinylase/aspartoacylase family protein, partial [Zoogloeaceae bacterium]|nr:succinylglutamate desuccinylase/aspartoacylase family protein [Zoogloeaceae bacterium]
MGLRNLMVIVLGLCMMATAGAFDAAAQEKQRAEWCTAVGQRLKSVDVRFCQSLPFRAGALQSVQGRPLMALETTPAAPTKPAARPVRILLAGGLHGDELTSISIIFRWLAFLETPAARAHHWYIAPLVNPDGLFSRPSRRVNGNGVDLNRNFPTPDWAAKAQDYWRRNTREDPRRFPGKTAMSEPETRWFVEAIETFKPDVIVSVHAPYGILDYDGASPPPPHRLGLLNLKPLGVHPGSLGNYGGIFKDIPVITIELANAGTMPRKEEQQQMWNDMLDWIDAR